jgi:hypothetical protein
MESKLKGLFGGGEDKSDAPATAAAAAAPTNQTTPLSGLFGGGEAGEKAKLSAQDFINRVQTGAPHEGFSHQEALTHLATAAQQASPEQIQRATRAAVEKMPDDQRADFAKMLKERMGGVDRSGTNAAASGGNSVDDVTGMLSQVLGTGGGGGLLGGLLGGGGSSGGGLGGMLGGLLGGGQSSNAGTTQSNSGGGIDDVLGGIFGSTAGKAAIGGIAAMVLTELMGKKH